MRNKESDGKLETVPRLSDSPFPRFSLFLFLRFTTYQGELMARGDQLGRQWKIIQTLLTSSGKSAAELAAELDIHPRTVYRDLMALQTAGFPIFTERTDGKSLWSLLDTMKHHIPVPFTLPELMG